MSPANTQQGISMPSDKLWNYFKAEEFRRARVNKRKQRPLCFRVWQRFGERPAEGQALGSSKRAGMRAGLSVSVPYFGRAFGAEAFACRRVPHDPHQCVPRCTALGIAPFRGAGHSYGFVYSLIASSRVTHRSAYSAEESQNVLLQNRCCLTYLPECLGSGGRI